MVALLAAMEQMQATLVCADAPARQLAGVAEWRQSIAAAVAIGSCYSRPAGMNIAPQSGGGRFLSGHATHAAWRDLCTAVLDALAQQRAHADRFATYWAGRAKTAPTASARRHAIKQAEIAASWSDAAQHAAAVGRTLVATEDSIQVPIGRVIERIGFHDVAADKRYHQRETR